VLPTPTATVTTGTIPTIARGVWSESFALDCPSLADELKGCEASGGLEPSGEVVSVDEVAQMGSQLIVGFIEVSFDGGVLDGAVHPLDLAVRPGVFGFG
jgi:hypothetical protein